MLKYCVTFFGTEKVIKWECEDQESGALLCGLGPTLEGSESRDEVHVKGKAGLRCMINDQWLSMSIPEESKGDYNA